MRRMTFVVAPLAAMALTVSGAGVASAAPLGDIADGLGTGMQVGGSLGGLVDMGLGSADGDLADLEGMAGLVGTLIGGAVGLGVVLIPPMLA